VKFIVDDVEEDWGYENNPFDFIHSRFIAASVKDVSSLVKKAYR